MKNVKTLKHQRGDFLVGLMIAIVIVSILGAGYWINLRDGQRDIEVKETISKVNMTAAALRATFGINGQYADVTTAVAVQSRAIPQDQRISGTNTAQNSFGGLISVTPVTLTSANDAILLTYPNVSPWACARTVIGTQNSARQITIGGTTVKALDATISNTDLTTACDVDEPVTIAWSIGRTGA